MQGNVLTRHSGEAFCLDSVLDVCAAVVKLNASAKASANPANVWTLHIPFPSMTNRIREPRKRPSLGVKQRGERCLWSRRTD
jgi:hypothetical protein